MNKQINIFEEKDTFGIMSNNFRNYMYLDGQKWPTVTNYIYSNLLSNPINKQILRLSKDIKNIKNVFQNLFRKEIHNIIKESIETSLEVKFKNTELSDKLINTGNSPIFYVSEDNFLGVGPNNSGQNVYGKYLVNMRHKLRISSINNIKNMHKAERERKIYETYIVEKGLTEIMREEGKDIKKYINKTPLEIIEILGRSNLEKKNPDYDVIIDLVRREQINPDIIKAVESPNILVPLVRKKNIRALQIINIKQQKEIIFDMYADYTLEKNYKELPLDKYKEAKEQEFENMGWFQKNNLENKLLSLYNDKKLSESLSKAIATKLVYHKIPSDQEVTEAENIEIKKENSDKLDIYEYLPETGVPILVYPKDYYKLSTEYKEYIEFSPNHKGKMLTIEGKLFPTISHYIATKCIFHIPFTASAGRVKKIFYEAYKKILVDSEKPIIDFSSFLSLDEINEKYNKLLEENYRNQVEYYAKKGIYKKFDNRLFQDILISTGNYKLVYKDENDNILGTGKNNKGKNIVGKHLMDMRSELKISRQNEKIDKLESSHIIYILENDEFMKDWVIKKVENICKVLMTMKNYLYQKNENYDIKIDAYFSSAVIDNIYQPCSHIYDSVHLVKAEVPEYFMDIIRKCPGFDSNIEEKNFNEVADVIWKRIVVIIYYLITKMKGTNLQNLRSIILNSDNTFSSDKKNYENCIESAVLNLLKGICNFAKQLSYDIDITELEVKTVASIILNSDVSEEIEENSEEEEDSSEEEEDNWLLPEEEEDIDDDDENYFSPPNVNNNIIKNLEEVCTLKNKDSLSNFIDRAIETIKVFPSKSEKIRVARINFFATQKT